MRRTVTNAATSRKRQTLHSIIVSTVCVSAMALTPPVSLWAQEPRSASAFGLPKPPAAKGTLTSGAVRLPVPQRKVEFHASPSVPLQVRQISKLPLYLVKSQESLPSSAEDDDDLLTPPQPKTTIKQPRSSSPQQPINNRSFYDDAPELNPQVIRQPKKVRQVQEDIPATPQPTDDEDLLPPKPERVNPNKDEEEWLLPPKDETPQQEMEFPGEVGDIPSPSDRPPKVPRAEIDDPNELDFDRNKVTPYKAPSIEGDSERVVPLPITPAPDDFPGFEPPEPDADTLPEPKRSFDLPKPKPTPVPPPQSQGQGALGQGTSPQLVMPHGQSPSFASPYASPHLMPWQQADLYTEYGAQPLMGERVQRPARLPGLPVGTERLSENRPTIAPLGTLPERLQSRHWEFKIARDLPVDGTPLPLMSNDACMVEFQAGDFAPNPQMPQPLNPCQEIQTYYGKSMVETQRPWVEWWRPFYTGGMYEPGVPVFSDVNLLTPSFLVYGDYRTGVGIHRAGGRPIRQWAHRLNLDMDLRLTGTERFHMFTGPLDHNGRFTRLDFSDSDNVDFEEELDFKPDTAFFEGDLGAITGSMIGDDAPFDLPFTMGIVPLLYQNGIWMEDAIVGFAVGSPWRHSKALNWSNFESTFFAGFTGLDSPAFLDNRDVSVLGTAWFVEAYNGYIEMDYAYLDDRRNLGRSYHNAALAYTRRYFGRISNSVRLIGNAGQEGSRVDRTADGGLLLIENSLISSQPSTVVPYFNMFVGSGRPQSVGRAGGSGGILRNTGINFETDGLTAYPTLNATGANSYGGAVGINILSADFRQQLVCELTALDRYGNPLVSGIAGPQYAIGGRYQRTINNRSLVRFDLMNGWLDNASNIYGLRSEFRWKF
jgi:hypothetical protein